MTPTRTLFLFAHPDDDTFIAGTMRSLLEQGAEIHGAWLTSGDFLGQGERREGELARAMEVLGLEWSRVHLLRVPDLGLVSHMNRAADLTSELLARINPGRVFVNAFEGGHPDHDVVNFLAYEGSRRSGLAPDVYEFPLYNGTGPFHHWRWRINRFPPGGADVLFTRLSDSQIDCKHQMMRIYASQWMFMVPARLACGRKRLKTEGEPYGPCPLDRDHTMPPHRGQLNYERWFNSFMKLRFEDYRAAVVDTRGARCATGEH